MSAPPPGDRASLSPLTALPTSFPTRSVSAALALSAAAICTAAGLGLAARPAAPADACALPTGIALSALAERDRGFVARRALACADYEHHRISAADYRAATARLDGAPAVLAAPPAELWATSVRDLSTQYSAASWAATHALGAPDVFPASGDQANAWASRGADDRVEYLELGFEPHRLAGVELFETFNPGAVSQVEVVTADGRRQTVYAAAATPSGQPALRHRLDFACTDAPVVAVRVTLDSPAVPGWNELDAVGALPCD